MKSAYFELIKGNTSKFLGLISHFRSFTSSFIFNSDLGPIENATIFTIDKLAGFVISQNGKNQFYMPHGMTTDREGNIYLTDVGLHQVFRLSSNFTVTLTLGEKLVPGHDDNHFCQPTDVAVASNGDIFVSDGYCNSRILKFDKNGKLIKQFKSPISKVASEAGDFLVPHSLALVEDLDLICVADRENRRIQCFAAGLKGRRGLPTGAFITKAEDVGKISGIREKNHHIIGVVAEDSDELESEMFAININSGKVTTFAKGLNAHSLAVDENGDIYLGKMHPNQIIRLHLS